MSPTQVAARFEAFVWYSNVRNGRGPAIQAEARSFAQKNWKLFRPVAVAGLGRLLLRIGRQPAARQRRDILRPVVEVTSAKN